MKDLWPTARMVALMAGLAQPLAAEPIPLRSGDHPGYTRLVVQLPAGARWQITPVPGGWEVDPGLRHSGFDLRGIWRPIGRSRLLDLSETGRGTLLLTSGCDCHLRAWQLGPRLVADVHDGPPRRGQGDIARYQPPPPSDPAAPALAKVPPPALAPAPATDPGLRKAVDEAARRDAARFPSDPMELAGYAEAARRAAELEASLRQALGQPGTAADLSEGYGVKPGSDLPLSAGGDPAPVVPDAARHGMTDDGRHCPAPDLYDPGSWVVLPADQPDFAGAATGLVREFDAWDQAASLKAAKYFLYHGFGAEAAQLLSQIPASPQRAALLEIAAILDADGAELSQPVHVLSGWGSCPSIVALWSVLADPRPASGQSVAAKDIVLAYQTLPGHLRQVLGPGLIFAFLDRQDAATADQLRHLMRLADADPTPATRLAEIRLEEALGARDEAIRLTDTALDAGSPPPELLAERARQSLAEGQPLDADTATALEALAFEYRHHQAGPGFQKILTEHQILAGDFLGARQRLEEKLRAHDVADLFRRLYAAAAGHADPSTLLRLTLPEPRGLGSAPRDEEIRLSLAEKLLSLGFAEESLTLLSQSDTGPARLTRAGAYLMLAQPEIALADLGQLDSAQAQLLRARAQEQLGQLDSAASLYRLGGSPEDAARIAVLQQEWQSAGGAPGPLAAVAQALEPQPVPSGSDPYALAQTLLSRSAGERQAFGWLVAPAPPPAN